MEKGLPVLGGGGGSISRIFYNIRGIKEILL